MNTHIQQWGNSSAIRLPKLILKDANITEKDTVEIIAKKNEILIKKIKPQHMTFAERMKGFTGVYESIKLEVYPAGEEIFWE
jgi:antitoxin component of MazEF toxin-antitoxin module